MGTIVPRKRADGSKSYRAQIILKKDGKVAWSESKTFDRRPAASAWIAARETELKKSGGLTRVPDPTLAIVIDRYVAELRKKIGRTKAQVLEKIKTYPIAELKCSKIGSDELVAFAQSLTEMQPQTRQNYMSHLGAVFAIARAAWKYPLDPQAMKDAMLVLKKLGVTSKGKSRDRRPTIDELDKLMEHFGQKRRRDPRSPPMQQIIAFAIFSTRRQEEITRITRRDLDAKHSRIMVRDMKHPGEKEGNDTLCDLPPEALSIIQAVRHNQNRIFPYSTDAISASFTRACKFLAIDDLHFHDLRHDGVSRLFEMGWTIPQVATVSGHRSWTSLKRYSHIRQSGDKYAGWKWLQVVAT